MQKRYLKHDPGGLRPCQGDWLCLARLRNASLVGMLEARRWLCVWLVFMLVFGVLPTCSGMGEVVSEPFRIGFASSMFTDACVVTRSGFEMMAEFNPQLAKQLTVPSESWQMVPAVFAFRANYNPVFKDKLISGVNDLKGSPAGRQVLTIFHSEDIQAQPASALDTALELIATHKRLVQENRRL